MLKEIYLWISIDLSLSLFVYVPIFFLPIPCCAPTSLYTCVDHSMWHIVLSSLLFRLICLFEDRHPFMSPYILVSLAPLTGGSIQLMWHKCLWITVCKREGADTGELTLEGRGGEGIRKIILMPMTFISSNDIKISLRLTVWSNRFTTNHMCLVKQKLILIR